MKSVRTWHFYLAPKVQDHPFMWGEFVIVSSGMFAAVSDYGNYSCVWRSFGSDIRKFLLHMKQDPYYFMNKFDSTQIVDWHITAKSMKTAIIERRKRDGQYSAQRARDEWNAVQRSDSVEELVMHLDGDYYHYLLEYVHRRLTHQVEAFVNLLCVPYLLPELQKSLEQDP